MNVFDVSHKKVDFEDKKRGLLLLIGSNISGKRLFVNAGPTSILVAFLAPLDYHHLPLSILDQNEIVELGVTS